MYIIPTHKDLVWELTNCQEKEDAYKAGLKEAAGDQAHVELIDMITRHLPDNSIPSDRPYLITDNHFNVHTQAEVLQMGPEIWGIYSLPYTQVPAIGNPAKRLNCLIHRQSGERLMFLYKMYERDMLEDNLVSFGCFTGDRLKPYPERRKDFNDLHTDQDWPQWDNLQEELRPKMPLFLPENMLADEAAMQTEITIVVETYVHEQVIAFSEKIFRALQTPRPWVMFNSPNAIAILRQYGFDVLDGIVDHSYDSTVNPERRADKILNAVSKIKPFGELDHNRLIRAATHNRMILQGYHSNLDNKVQSIIEKFK